MTRRRPNSSPTADLLTALAISGCAFLFAGASCESKKPQEQPKEGADVVLTDPDSEATKQAVFEGKKVTDVGPKAPAIFAIAGLQGYTEPCGCTLDVMLGGIDRLAGFADDARALHSGVEFVDAGDLWFEKKTLEETEIPQEKAKVDVVRQGLKRMKLAVTVPGEKDFALGDEYYLEQTKAAGITPIAANLTIAGAALAKTHKVTIDGVDVVFVGVVDPSLYEGVADIATMEPKAALAPLAKEIQDADVAVLLAHGDLPFAKSVLELAPGADFAVVGHPRETDQVDEIADAFTLEPYDQGRFFGILKLFGAKDANGAKFVNARQGSKAEVEKIERQIEHVNNSINRMPPATPGNEPEVLLTLRKRLEELEARRQEIQNADLQIPDGKPAFLWRSIAMEPGYQPDAEMAKIRESYNKKLKELNSSVDFEVPEAKPGEAVYIGSNTCAQCHGPATKFWEGTAHGKALTTLVDRDKDFDQKCIGCHVDGYEKPGGSVIGKLQYDIKLPNAAGKEFEVSKDLRHVGCESCHGPGSKHYFEPQGADGKPANIIRDPTVEQCNQCHVPEHSPRFLFDVYVDEITGEGHARSK